MSTSVFDFTPIEKINRDVRDAAVKMLSQQEVRFLVDYYYMIQEDRKRNGNQVLATEKSAEPNAAIQYLFSVNKQLESQIKLILDKYSSSDDVGAWMKSICGIGPVISAGFLAHIDIEECPTAGHIWSFAGLVNAKWWSRAEADALVAKELDTLKSSKKGGAKKNALNYEQVAVIAQKTGQNLQRLWKRASDGKATATAEEVAAAIAHRPWNNKLKVLCWKLGESFTKTCNLENDFYGKLYVQRKQLEWAKNLKGDYAEQAKQIVEVRNFGSDTDAIHWYKGTWQDHAKYLEVALKFDPGFTKSEDKLLALPPAHIHARAKRWAVKLFIAHLHEVMYFSCYKKLPPNPYPMAHLGHTHRIEIPNAELIEGLIEARRNHEHGK